MGMPHRNGLRRVCFARGVARDEAAQLSSAKAFLKAGRSWNPVADCNHNLQSAGIRPNNAVCEGQNNKGGLGRPWIEIELDYSNLELLIFTVAVPMGKFTVNAVTPNNWFKASAAAWLRVSLTLLTVSFLPLPTT